MEKTGEGVEGVGCSLTEITGVWSWNKLGDGEAKTTVLASRTRQWDRGVPSWLTAPQADQLRWPLSGLRVLLIRQDQCGSGAVPGQDQPPRMSEPGSLGHHRGLHLGKRQLALARAASMELREICAFWGLT